MTTPSITQLKLANLSLYILEAFRRLLLHHCFRRDAMQASVRRITPPEIPQLSSVCSLLRDCKRVARMHTCCFGKFSVRGCHEVMIGAAEVQRHILQSQTLTRPQWLLVFAAMHGKGHRRLKAGRATLVGRNCLAVDDQGLCRYGSGCGYLYCFG